MQSSLPIYHSDNKDFKLLQTAWRSVLEPILKRPQNHSTILKEVSLAIGTNVIKTTLDRKLQGWKLVRQRSSASIYDAQDGNPNPQTTLILISSADVVVDIEVF